MEAGALKNIMAIGDMTQGVLAGTSSLLGGNYEADQAKFNASMAEIQAQDAIARGDDEAARLLRDIAGITGGQKKSYAAQGVDATIGTPRTIQDQTKELGEKDAATIRTNAKRQALGFRSQSGQYKTAADFAKLKGQVGFGTSLIGGGLQAARRLS